MLIAEISYCWLICAAGIHEVEDITAYWRRQKDYLCNHPAVWLPTIGMPANALVHPWSEGQLAALCGKSCLLIVDRPVLVFALRLLQGLIEQSQSTERFAVLGKVADLDPYLNGSSIETWCEGYGLQLVAAYSTSKPKITRLASHPCMCQKCAAYV